VGVPVAWVWVASQLQPTVGQGTSEVAALIVIAGPLGSYFALIALAGRFSRARHAAPRPQRMAWNRSRDEIRESARHTTTFEQVVLLATLLVGAGFEVWFFFFAHQQPWGT
jgi:hypothetical protein